MTDWMTILHGEILNPKASLQVFYENTSRHTHKKEKKAKITLKKSTIFKNLLLWSIQITTGLQSFKITKVLIKNQNCV